MLRKKQWSNLASGMLVTVAISVATTARGQELTEISIGVYLGSSISLPYYIAASQGFAEKERIKIELVGVPTGPQQLSALVSGSVDVGQPAITVSYPAMARGDVDLVVLGGGRRDAQVLIATPDRELPNAGKPYPAPLLDLKGASIAVTARGSFVEKYVARMLSDAGLDPDADVSWITAGSIPNTLAAFKANQVDAAIVQAENIVFGFASDSEYQIITNALDGTDGGLAKNSVSGPLTADRRWHDENLLLVERLCRALGAASRFLRDPGDAATVATAEWLKTDTESARKLLDMERERYTFSMPESVWPDQFVLVGLEVPSYGETVSATCQDAL